MVDDDSLENCKSVKAFVGSNPTFSAKIYHYVYCIENLINEKFYIGKHSTSNLNDDYMGSGAAIKFAIKKHGKENFRKSLLYEFENEIDALNKEQEILIEITKQKSYKKHCYNITKGGTGVLGYKHSFETKKKISEGQLRRFLSSKHPSLGKKGKSSPTFGLTGFKSFNSKLSKDDVERIKMLFLTTKLSNSKIGKLFNVSKQTIMRIRNNTSSYCR